MDEKMSMRGIKPDIPKTFDEATQSVQVVAVTENPVRIWDWRTSSFIDEVLLISGMKIRHNKQIPLLDCHNRNSVDHVLGSARDFTKNGDQLECRVYFSNTTAGRNAAQNVRDGHLTDFSVGYQPTEYEFVPEGQEKAINGAIYRGPVKVTAEWILNELSVTPIGADHMATARSWEDGKSFVQEGVHLPDTASPPYFDAAGEAVTAASEISADMIDFDQFSKTHWTDEDYQQVVADAMVAAESAKSEPAAVPPKSDQQRALAPSSQKDDEAKETKSVVDILFIGLIIYMVAALLSGLFL